MFPAYAVRNFGFWYAMNEMSSDESLEKKSLKMFGIGALSSAPDTLGNFVMKYDPQISMGECYLKAAKEAYKMSPKTILAASSVRGASVMIGGLIFSKEFFGFLEKTIESTFSQPNSSVTKSSAKVVAKKDEKEIGK